MSQIAKLSQPDSPLTSQRS